MLESASASLNTLTVGQLHLIARKHGAFSGKSLVDVGCGNGNWIQQQSQRGRNIHGMEEKQFASAPAGNAITLGSPAAAVPWDSHSLDTVLFRGTSVFQGEEFSPELMIALANLGSSLKARGRLLIPVSGATSEEIERSASRWQNQLSIFPGSSRVRTLTTGIRAYLTLAFLFGGQHQVSVLEFQVSRKLVSRLEWHRLARTEVMKRMNPPAAA